MGVVVLGLTAGLCGCGGGSTTASEYGSARIAEARELLSAGSLEEAESIARSVISRDPGDEASGRRNNADAIDVVVECLWRSGKATLDETLSLAGQAVALREALRAERADLATSFSNRGIVLYFRGDFSGAVLDLRRSVDELRRAVEPTDRRLAIAYFRLANALQMDGSFEDAREAYRASITVFEGARNAESDVEFAKALLGMGVLLSDIGAYREAADHLEHALRINSTVRGAHDAETAKSLNALGGLSETLRAFREAEADYRRALEIFSALEDLEHVAAVKNNLAFVLLRRNGVDEAERLLQDALRGYAEYYEGEVQVPDVAHVYSNLGAVRLARHDPEGALRHYDKALAILGTSLPKGHPDITESIAGRGSARARAGDLVGAVADFRHASEAALQHARATVGLLPERVALEYARKSQSHLDALMSVSLALGDAESIHSAYDVAVRSRATVLDVMASRRRAAAGLGESTKPLFDDLSRKTTRWVNAMLRGDDEEVVARAARDKYAAEEALAKASASYADSVSRSRLGLDDVLESLPSDTALVSYWDFEQIPLAPTEPRSRIANRADEPDPVRLVNRSPGRMLVAIVIGTGRGDPTLVQIGRTDRVEELVRSWRAGFQRVPREIGPRAREDERGSREAGRALRRTVWDPVLPHVGSARRVFVVPDGVLNLINVAALPDDGDGYLIETPPLVHYLSAERDLVRPGKGAKTSGGILLVGGVDYDTSAPSALETSEGGRSKEVGAPSESTRGASCDALSKRTWDELRGTLREVEGIAQEWAARSSDAFADRVDLLTGSRSSEANFKHAAPGHLVVHLATHGFILDDTCPSALSSPTTEVASRKAAVQRLGLTLGENPLLLSGLVLAGANSRLLEGGALEGDDGLLTAEEIAALDLVGVEWAVLSGCETGLGSVRSREGVQGLRRAFQVAGAETLIMSLWSVSDLAAGEWMKGLYAERIRGLETIEAVREAGLRVLRHRREAGSSTHPFWWGAFVAAGDWE